MLTVAMFLILSQRYTFLSVQDEMFFSLSTVKKLEATPLTRSPWIFSECYLFKFFKGKLALEKLHLSNVASHHLTFYIIIKVK